MSTLVFAKMFKNWLPLALLGLAGGLALASQNLGSEPTKLQVGIPEDPTNGVTASTTEGQAPSVTINGQPLDLGDDGSLQVQTGGDTVTVTTSGSTTNTNSGRTTVTNADGSIDIQVDSNSSGSGSRTRIRYGGNSRQVISNDSSINVKIRGEGGNVSVTND